jgi:alkylhydroperoxidase family enzyme
MTDPRIPPVENPDDEVRAMLANTLVTADARPTNVFATIGHHPLLLRRMLAMGDTFIGSGRLAPRERELVILRVAASTRSAYEWGQHVLIGREAGISAEIGWITEPLDHPAAAWSDDERAVLTLTDELLASASVSDDTWARVARTHETAEVLELVALVGFYRLLAGVLRAARVQTEPGVPGPPPGAAADWI